MVDALLLLLIFVSSYLAFACFALAQWRHWHAAVGSERLPRQATRSLRAAGGVLLVLSCIVAVAHEGIDYGALLFCTLVSVAALSVALTLAWYPRALRPLVLLLPHGGRLSGLE